MPPAMSLGRDNQKLAGLSEQGDPHVSPHWTAFERPKVLSDCDEVAPRSGCPAKVLPRSDNLLCSL
jgi:hypothetical protein